MCKQKFFYKSKIVSQTRTERKLFMWQTKTKTNASYESNRESSDRCCRPNATVPKSLFYSVLYSRLGAKREENTRESVNVCWIYSTAVAAHADAVCIVTKQSFRARAVLRYERWDPECFILFLFFSFFAHTCVAWHIKTRWARTIAMWRERELKQTHMSECDDGTGWKRSWIFTILYFALSLLLLLFSIIPFAFRWCRCWCSVWIVVAVVVGLRERICTFVLRNEACFCICECACLWPMVMCMYLCGSWSCACDGY